MKRRGGKTVSCYEVRCLSALSTDASGHLNVLGHDCDTLGVDGAQVGVLEETDQVGFGSFLKSADGSTLETQVRFEVLCDFTNETLEWQLADQQFSRLLVTTNFTKSDSTGPVNLNIYNHKFRSMKITG